MSKFKVGDTVEVVSNHGGFNMVIGTVFEVDSITYGKFGSKGNIYFPNKGSGMYECDLVLFNSNKSNNNMLEKFKMLMKGEPGKSFCKAGITDVNYNLTTDGKEIFLQWLLKENGEKFKSDVVDGLLKEDK